MRVSGPDKIGLTVTYARHMPERGELLGWARAKPLLTGRSTVKAAWQHGNSCIQTHPQVHSPSGASPGPWDTFHMALLVKLFILGVFAVLAVLMWRGWQDRQASPSWPWVEGTITQSQTRRNVDDPHNELTHARWLLVVKYDYQVNGQTFTGDRVKALPEQIFTEDLALDALKSLGVGQRVRVYYDPAKPQSSVLQPGA